MSARRSSSSKPRRALEQLTLVGEVEVLGVRPGEIDGLRRADREGVLQRPRQLDRAVLDLAQLRLSSKRFFNGVEMATSAMRFIGPPGE